jgi:hypothetical protein
MRQEVPDVWKNIEELSAGVALRFELGDPFDNGTEERVRQSVFRAAALLESVFSSDDTVHLYIKEWAEGDATAASDYIYELLSQHELRQTIACEPEKETDADGTDTEVQRLYKVSVASGALSAFPYRAILTGIANAEQGRKPSIGQQVYFISMKKDILFYMYDDRGCIISAKDKGELRRIYKHFNSWLADSGRVPCDAFFRGVE